MKEKAGSGNGHQTENKWLMAVNNNTISGLERERVERTV